MATLIKVDGTKKTVTPRNKKNGFTLDEIYELLGCSMIEHISVLNGKEEHMIVDEEGKLKEGWTERINAEATRIFDKSYGAGWDVVVGDVLMCSSKEWK